MGGHYWVWTIAKGVFIGQTMLIVAAAALYLGASWLWTRWILMKESGRVSPHAIRLMLLIGLSLLAGFLISRKLGGLFDVGVWPTTVHVDSKELEKERVKPKPGLLERVQLGQVKPTQVRIGLEPSAAGKKRVGNYCTPTSAKAGPVPDSATKRGTGPRILPDFGGRVGRGKVLLGSTLNDGRPWGASYKVHGRWTFASDGDSVIVRSERLWSRLARGLIRCGAITGAGAGIGYLTDSHQPLQGAARGAALAGGTCAALELAF